MKTTGKQRSADPLTTYHTFGFTVFELKNLLQDLGDLDPSRANGTTQYITEYLRDYLRTLEKD
jgi:hypothetical protein